MPKLFIISGCNGSGKTTASYTLLPEILDCREFVNSDEFAKSLSPFDPSAASITASRYMVMKINYLLERYDDFSIETTLATRSLVGIIQRAKERGYSVTLLYFWLNSPELAIKRVQARVKAGGHHIDDTTVRRRYEMGLRYLFDTYMKICDEWIIGDNSKSPFCIVAQGSKSSTEIIDPEKFLKISNIAFQRDEQA
ncbi:MAG: zeta toxin family protein [Bacteroidia bacterium]|nr:zeta toxin family protein [Bacteroidia bacterium]